MRRRSSAILLVALLAGGCRRRTAEPGQAPAPAAAPAASQPVRIVYPAAPGSFVAIAADIDPSVVSIKSTTKVSGGPGSLYPGMEEESSLGSGFVIDAEGYVLTNHHVIAHGTDLRVVLPTGEVLNATVVGRDPRFDVGLLKIAGSPRLRPVRLGNSDEVQVGEWVIAVGNPFGARVVSAGIVSARPRGERDLTKGERDLYRSLLQTDASIHAGNSGGPLVNTAGEVIGIATTLDGSPSNLGYAVPINQVKQMLPMLKKDGSVARSWLGAFVRPVDPELAPRLGLAAPTGAYVTQVVPDGPAYKAGLRPGDVILKFDAVAVTDKTLPTIASATPPGKHVAIVIWRANNERSLDLLTEKMPE